MNIFIGLSLLFIAIGFIVTENNAKYLLAGYNTMSREERENFDIKAYIPYFKKFHIFLGISFFVIGTLLTYFASDDVVGIFTAAYPIAGYIYFFISTRKFTKGNYSKKNKMGNYIIIAVLLFVIVLFSREITEHKIIAKPDSIEIEGNYGEIIPKNEIKSIELVNEKPKIAIRTHGFSVGNIKKGDFKTDKCEEVKLILNADNKPYILITKQNGQQIYYSSKKESNEKIFKNISSVIQIK